MGKALGKENCFAECLPTALGKENPKTKKKTSFAECHMQALGKAFF